MAGKNEQLFEELPNRQNEKHRAVSGPHLGQPGESQLDSSMPSKRLCLTENESSGSDAGIAVCGGVHGSPNENHMDAVPPPVVVDTARAESASFRRLPAMDQSECLMEVRAVEEYNKFFQGQV